MNSAAWSEEIDRSKDTEHREGKNGLAKKGRFTKIWLISDGQPTLPRRVSDPSGTSDIKSSRSSQFSNCGAHGEDVSSGGDQQGE